MAVMQKNHYTKFKHTLSNIRDLAIF